MSPPVSPGSEVSTSGPRGPFRLRQDKESGTTLSGPLRHLSTMPKAIIFNAHRCIFGERFWIVKSHKRAAQSVTRANWLC